MTRLTIKSVAAMIKARWPDLRVEVSQGYCCTDRKPRGCRYITHRGKGRVGTRIMIYDPTGRRLLDHNNAEPYRRVSEVVDWMERYARTIEGSLG